MTSRAAAFKLLLSRRAPQALSLDFTSGVLDPRITFSRGTLGTRVDSTGKITYGPNNLSLRSQDFTQIATWTDITAATTRSGNALVAPDGTTTATFVADNATTNSNYGAQQTIAVRAGANYLMSVYIQRKDWQYVTINCASGINSFGYWDVLNGTVAGTPTNISSQTITSVGGGWYRLSFVFSPTTASVVFSIIQTDSSSTSAHVGVVGKGTYFWGAQLEAVTYQTTPGTYQPTTATAYYGPRFGYDPVRLNALGLLIEEARTNLIIQSGNTANAAWAVAAVAKTSTNNSAPDGTSTAALITADGTSAVHAVGLQTANVTNGTQYAISMFVKAGTATIAQLAPSATSFATTVYANFSLSGSGSVLATGAGASSATIQAFPNGWYRVSLVATANASSTADIDIIFITAGTDTRAPTNTSAGTLQAWGGQLEATTANYPGPTSYIPTGAAAVARNADLASMTGSNFSSWFNPAAGTFVTTVTPPGDYNQDVMALSVTDGTTSNQHFVSKDNAAISAAGKRWCARTSTGGVVQDTLATAVDGAATTAHLAYAFAAADFAFAGDGATIGTAASGTLPVVNQLWLGARNSTLQLNGHIAALDYYNIRQSNGQLNILTAWLPSLSLDFTTGVLDPRVTYTGASLATMVDSTGKITYKPNNLCQNSQAFTSWGVAGSVAITGGQTDPTGGTTASRLVFGGSGNPNRMALVLNGSTVSGVVLSIYLKGSVGGEQITFSDGGGTNFNVTLTTSWVRYYGVASAFQFAVWATSGTPTIFAAFAQAEAVTYQTTPGPYLATGATAYYGPRFGYDAATLLPLGLLIEEARTNLALRSNDFSNAAWKVAGTAAKVGAGGTGPDGQTAYEISFGATPASEVYQDSLSVTNGVTYAQTVYIKAKTGTTTIRLDFYDGSVDHITSDISVNSTSWTRVSNVAASTASSGGANIGIVNNAAGNSGNVYVACAQLEACTANYPGPTSYIPTTTVAVARVADVVSMTGTNFSSWYNPLAGTFVATVTPPGTYNEQAALFGASDTTTTNIHYIYRSNGAGAAGLKWVGQTSAGNVVQAQIASGNIITGAADKLAYAYAANDFALAANNALIGTDTSGILPAVSQLNIGDLVGGGVNINSHIAKLPYYPARIPNTPLTALTA